MLGVVLLAGCAAVPSGAGLVPSQAKPSAAGTVLAFQAFCPDRRAVTPTRAIPGSGRSELVPMGVSADGRTGYVSAWTQRFSGVAAIDVRTGALRPIQRFARPSTEQADGAWGGRWLVWEQTYSLQSLDHFTVHAWDARSGTVTLIGRSRDAPKGTPWPSPWHPPAVSGQYAAWAQGYGPGGLVQIRVADLLTGQVRVVARGHVQAPFIDGGLVVWPQSDRPGALTTLHAYAIAAGKPAPLPLALRSVTGTDLVVADGTRTAYVDAALTGLYYSPRPSVPARLMLRLGAGMEISSLSIGKGLLAWTTTEATYLASTVTGRYVQVTPAYGLAVTGAGPTALVADAPARQSAHPSLVVRPVSVRGLAAIRRSGRRHSPGTGQRAQPCGRPR
jgi:hypothetical protein